jgi:hypothetical protein
VQALLAVQSKNARNGTTGVAFYIQKSIKKAFAYRIQGIAIARGAAMIQSAIKLKIR